MFWPSHRYLRVLALLSIGAGGLLLGRLSQIEQLLLRIFLNKNAAYPAHND